MLILLEVGESRRLNGSCLFLKHAGSVRGTYVLDIGRKLGVSFIRTSRGAVPGKRLSASFTNGACSCIICSTKTCPCAALLGLVIHKIGHHGVHLTAFSIRANGVVALDEMCRWKYNECSIYGQEFIFRDHETKKFKLTLSNKGQQTIIKVKVLRYTLFPLYFRGVRYEVFT